MSLTKSLTLLFALTLVLTTPPFIKAKAISCSDIYTTLFPCLGYFQGSGASNPSAECCSGIKGIVSTAQTAADRQSTCACLKAAAAGVSGSNLALAGALPAKCGVSVPYKINPSTDCAKVR